MGRWLDRELDEITDGKEIIIECPKVTVNVDINGKREKKTYHDITDVFNDFEEGKVMGRIWRFEQ